MYPSSTGVQLTRALGRGAWGFFLFGLFVERAEDPHGATRPHAAV
jgi:hypothetical protein